MSKTLAAHLADHGNDHAEAWKAMCDITDEHLALAKDYIENFKDGSKPGLYEHLLRNKPFAFREVVTIVKFAYDRGARAPA